MEGFLLVGASRQQLPSDAAARLFSPEGYDLLLSQVCELDVQESFIFLGEEYLIFLVIREPGRGLIAQLFTLIAERSGLDTAKAAGIGYALEGEAALHHLFEIAGALNEGGPAEPRLAGRLQECHVRAKNSGASGSYLDKVLPALIATAESTGLQSPSAHAPMTAVALEVAKSLHGDLSSCRGLMIGLGEMALDLGDELLRAGLKNWVVMHPSQNRASDQASKMGGHYRAWDDLSEALASAEVIVCDRGSGQWCVLKAEVEAALKSRKRRPILIIDAALPGDVEDSVHDLEDAFLFRLEDLERLAREDTETRLAPSIQARDAVNRDFEHCLQAITEAQPSETQVLEELRQYFQRQRQEVLAEGHLDAETATAKLIDRLLRAPLAHLHEEAGRDPKNLSAISKVLNRLFGLNEDALKDADDNKGDGAR